MDETQIKHETEIKYIKEDLVSLKESQRQLYRLSEEAFIRHNAMMLLLTELKGDVKTSNALIQEHMADAKPRLTLMNETARKADSNCTWIGIHTTLIMLLIAGLLASGWRLWELSISKLNKAEKVASTFTDHFQKG